MHAALWTFLPPPFLHAAIRRYNFSAVFTHRVYPTYAAAFIQYHWPLSYNHRHLNVGALFALRQSLGTEFIHFKQIHPQTIAYPAIRTSTVYTKSRLMDKILGILPPNLNSEVACTSVFDAPLAWTKH